MAHLRFKALDLANNRPKVQVDSNGKISEYFASDVFGLPQMQAIFSPDFFKKVKKIIYD
ncbi:MAG: hypothetical protein RLP13_06805 [Cytophagales bacterium]